MDEFYLQAEYFLRDLFKEIHDTDLQIEKHWLIDHICYRSSSLSKYNELKNQFAQFSNLINESDVNGRPIVIFKLHRPIRFQDRDIRLIELPAPKPGRPRSDGFEHIEVVCDLPFEQLQKNSSNFKTDSSGLQKNFNQEFEIVFSKGSVKFHHLSLASVVNLEQNKHVFKSILDLNILEELRQYNPLIAGTFPLRVFTPGSDVDILISADNLLETKEHLTKNYGERFRDFKITENYVDSEPTVIANFSNNGLSYEIFAQVTPSVLQRGYRHFLIEERVLSIGGEQLLKEVNALRKQGLKTEPAFAQCLGLKGDPYLALLDLQTWPESRLRSLLHL